MKPVTAFTVGTISGLAPLPSSAAWSSDIRMEEYAYTSPSIRPSYQQFRSPWSEAAISKLNQLSLLAPNWDSYGAAQVSRESIEHAKTLLESLAMLEALEAPTIGATPEGLVGLSWQTASWSMDVEIGENGLASLVHLEGPASEGSFEEHGQPLYKIMSVLAERD